MSTRPVSNPFGIGGLSKSSRFELLALFASPRVEASSGEHYSKLCGPKGPTRAVGISSTPFCEVSADSHARGLGLRLRGTGRS